MIRRSEAAGHLVPRAAGKLRWPSVAGQRRSLAGQASPRGGYPRTGRPRLRSAASPS
jgi:hypothetical protein